jgi:hypothetical protein
LLALTFDGGKGFDEAHFKGGIGEFSSEVFSRLENPSRGKAELAQLHDFLGEEYIAAHPSFDAHGVSYFYLWVRGKAALCAALPVGGTGDGAQSASLSRHLN